VQSHGQNVNCNGQRRKRFSRYVIRFSQAYIYAASLVNTKWFIDYNVRDWHNCMYAMLLSKLHVLAVNQVMTHSLFVVMSGPHVGVILNEFALP